MGKSAEVHAITKPLRNRPMFDTNGGGETLGDRLVVVVKIMFCLQSRGNPAPSEEFNCTKEIDRISQSFMMLNLYRLKA
jgi:hypothetical protein